MLSWQPKDQPRKSRLIIIIIIMSNITTPSQPIRYGNSALQGVRSLYSTNMSRHPNGSESYSKI